MSEPKPSRRKASRPKLEPIDWRELANDAVLNGNMSTLFRRPAGEDPRQYASEEALVEIEKRSLIPTVGTPPPGGTGETEDLKPTGGLEPPIPSEPAVYTSPESTPTVGSVPAGGFEPATGLVPTGDSVPTVGRRTSVGGEQSGETPSAPTGWRGPSAGIPPTVAWPPTVGLKRFRIKPIRDVQDALTLAGQVLYRAMYGIPDGARAKSCTKGYRQLAAETHLDKDTVRDLIADFKQKGILREIGTYDPDTRSSKTYEVLSYRAILQVWREAGILYVTPGRRPQFCDTAGRPLSYEPTVGGKPAVGSRRAGGLAETAGPQPVAGPVGAVPTGGQPPPVPVGDPPTDPVGRAPTLFIEKEGKGTTASPARLLARALEEITGRPVDQEAVDRLLGNCRAEAADCTTDEILEFAWSKAFLFRSGKIDNPVGFLITQVPKHFRGEAFRLWRAARARDMAEALPAACASVESDTLRRRMEQAERFRTPEGIDLRAIERAEESDEGLKEWARRMLKLGFRHRPSYE